MKHCYKIVFLHDNSELVPLKRMIWCTEFDNNFYQFFCNDTTFQYPFEMKYYFSIKLFFKHTTPWTVLKTLIEN